MGRGVRDGRRVFAQVRAEWLRVERALALVTGETAPPQSNPALARSIAHPFPYIDPLNHPQVELLHRIGWARLLKRVFDIDMHACPYCGSGELKIIAAILERPVIEKILTHLG